MNCPKCFAPLEENCEKCPNCKILLNKPVNSIKEVIIEGLFNKYNYKINFENDENVSILIAPNGYGKTTILNFLNFFLAPNNETYNEIKTIPVQKFQCNFLDGTFFCYEKLSNDYVEENTIKECKKAFENYNNKVKEFRNTHLLANNVLSNKNFLLKNKIYSFEQFLYKLTISNQEGIREINFLDELNVVFRKESDFLSFCVSVEKSILFKMSNIRYSEYQYGSHFIKTNKITGINNDPELFLYIQNVLTTKNNDFSFEFIDGLCKYITTSTCMYQFQNRIRKLECKDTNRSLSDKDISKKLLQRKDMFQHIFNRENENTNKIIDYSPKEGFVIIQKAQKDCDADIESLLKGKKNYIINPENLSMGEKNLFALYFEVLFGNFKNSIYLIDEPEVSLHIEWQEHIIDYMKEIAKLTSSQIIIATHSPSVINGNFDLLAKKEIVEL